MSETTAPTSPTSPTAPSAPRPLSTSPSPDLPLPPGPRGPALLQTLVFGNLRHLVLPRLRRRYGDVVHLRLFPERDAVSVANLELIRQVFAGPPEIFHAGEGNIILKPVMGEHSVLLTDEQVHLRARKLLMPAFHGAALRGYRELVARLAAEEVERWAPGQPFDSHERMRALTLEVILRVVFGVAEGARLDELREVLGRTVDIGALDMFGWHKPELQRYGRWRRNAALQARGSVLLHAEIAERRAAGDLAERSDVLSRLLRVPGADGEPGLSDEELRDQLVTLLLAGHETTATALAWSLHYLARDPQRLKRALAAADDPGPDGAAYLEAVTKEAMRIRPVIGEVARRLTTDIELGGYRIPAGWTIMPSINLVHGDPAHYPDPERFRPERFLDGTGPAAGTWFPFGGGVRRCLGAGFSLMESVEVLRAVLTRYRLAPERERTEGRRPRHITMVPARGARIVLTAR